MIPSNGGASMLLDVRLHLLISPVPSFLTILPSPWNTSSPPLFQNPKPLQHHRIRCSSAKRSGSNWDSNAERFRTGRFRFRDGAEEGRRREKRKWLSDEDDESSQFEEDPEAFDEQLWDTFWIFKVFSSIPERRKKQKKISFFSPVVQPGFSVVNAVVDASVEFFGEFVHRFVRIPTSFDRKLSRMYHAIWVEKGSLVAAVKVLSELMKLTRGSYFTSLFAIEDDILS